MKNLYIFPPPFYAFREQLYLFTENNIIKYKSKEVLKVSITLIVAYVNSQ